MALDTSNPLYSVAPFSHSSAEDFRNQYLQTYHASSSYLAGSKTRPSETPVRHSSRRAVSHSPRPHDSPSPAVSGALAQESPSGSSSPPPDLTPVSESLSMTLNTHPPIKHKYGSLRGVSVNIPRSQSYHSVVIGTRSTSGSGSDAGSNPNTHSPPWHTYHPPPSSMTQRKLSNQHVRSGSTSDGSIAIPVDLKRLLSKPALPSSSPVMLLSDSDSQNSLRRRPRPRSTSRTRAKAKIPREPSDPSEIDKSPQDKEKQTSLPPTPQESPPAPLTPQSEPAKSLTLKEQKPPKVRHLVKRHSSPNKEKTAQSSAAPIPAVPVFGQTRTRHSPTSNAAFFNPSRSPSLHDSVRLSGSRQSSNRAPAPRHSPSALTPAGAVAEAYKQQEARRETLASASQRADENHRGRSRVTSPRIDDNVTPYYTVLGSRNSKVVAVDNPRDDDWELRLDAIRSTEERLRLPPSITAPQTLTRKISGKWKKAVWNPCDAGQRSRSHSIGTAAGDPGNDSRPSLHETRYTNRGNDDTKSLRLSLEKFTEISPFHSPTPDRKGTWSGSPQSHPKPTPRRVHSEVLPGGKMWKLIKRISIGGMREKYQRQESPPPVPALPKYSPYQSVSGSQDGHDSNHKVGAVSHFTPSRTSMSRSHPLSRHRSPSPQSSRHTALATSIGHGANAATFSSSPGSSDVALVRSQGSSSSSNARESSPLPRHIIGQHIIPPNELYRLEVDNDASQAITTSTPLLSRHGSRRADDYWISRSPEVELVSLSPPPVRPAAVNNADAAPVRIPSPIIPSFSTADAINTFGSRKSPMTPDKKGGHARPPLSVFTTPPPGPSSTPPPPRPPRNPRRALSKSRSVTPSVGGDDASPVAGHQDDMEHSTTDLHRRQTSSDIHDGSTPTWTKRRSRSLEAIPRRRRKMTLTYREMGEATTPTLTEQQKADKWDDLLARSARAGGTLHISGEDPTMDDPQISDLSEATFGPKP